MAQKEEIEEVEVEEQWAGLGKGKDGEEENKRNEEEVKGMTKNSRKITEAEEEENKME